jgi:dephospho-CoA kinase
MRIIGLTGGIGSGKSTVAGFLAELGATVIDLDKTGHEVLRLKEVRDKLTDIFGREILDAAGNIDRRKLGNKVFNDRGLLLKLNAVTHPAIDAVVREKVAEQERRGTRVVVLEAAVLLDARRGRQADEVWVTTAPEAAVLRRLAARSGYTDTETRARMGSQISDEERLRQADVVITNDGSPDELREKVTDAWRKLQERL